MIENFDDYSSQTDSFKKLRVMHPVQGNAFDLDKEKIHLFQLCDIIIRNNPNITKGAQPNDALQPFKEISNHLIEISYNFLITNIDNLIQKEMHKHLLDFLFNMNDPEMLEHVSHLIQIWTSGQAAQSQILLFSTNISAINIFGRLINLIIAFSNSEHYCISQHSLNIISNITIDKLFDGDSMKLLHEIISRLFSIFGPKNPINDKNYETKTLKSVFRCFHSMIQNYYDHLSEVEITNFVEIIAKWINNFDITIPNTCISCIREALICMNGLIEKISDLAPVLLTFKFYENFVENYLSVNPTTDPKLKMASLHMLSLLYSTNNHIKENGGLSDCNLFKKIESFLSYENNENLIMVYAQTVSIILKYSDENDVFLLYDTGVVNRLLSLAGEGSFNIRKVAIGALASSSDRLTFTEMGGLINSGAIPIFVQAIEIMKGDDLINLLCALDNLITFFEFCDAVALAKHLAEFERNDFVEILEALKKDEANEGLYDKIVDGLLDKINMYARKVQALKGGQSEAIQFGNDLDY